MDKPHPIALNEVFFTRLVVISIPQHEMKDPAGLTYLPENSINVEKIEENPGQYIATMRTVLNPKLDPIDPYHIDIECVGTFRASEDLDDSEAKRGVTITAHNVLYGAIRECISWTTGRQPYGALTLGLSVLKPKVKPEEKLPEESNN